MNVGFVGLGKLGLPCAMAAALHHDVVGTDISPVAEEILRTTKYQYQEQGAQQMLETTSLVCVPSIAEVVEHSDIVFVAVQTPHDPIYEGTTRLPATRQDFDYRFLRAAVSDIAEAAAKRDKTIVLAVISTVLPGTTDRELRPLLNGHVKLAYNPFFIAMGTTIRDYLLPEFVVLGVDDPDAADMLEKFYRAFILAPVVRMSVRSAEMTKVFYNLFVGLKIAMANTAMHVADKTGANCDDVMGALCLAGDRLISDRYLRGGMGDGGGCHPRDAIALSWLARELSLGYDLFGDVMRTREKQTEWIANIARHNAENRGLPVVILGRAFKANSNITTGSASLLLAAILREKDVPTSLYDPVVDGCDAPRPWDGPAVFVYATQHAVFDALDLPPESVVIDPWGRADGWPGVEVVRLGRR